MNKIYFLNFVFVLLPLSWAHGAVTEKAQLFFEPVLSVCQKENSGFLECKVTQNDFEPELEISLEKIGQINELEVWKGQYAQKISLDAHSAEFQVIFKMQRDLETNHKEYELVFQINDQVGGNSTSTVTVDSLEKLNFTKINLPEIKSDNKVYLISLSYGPASESPYLIGDLAFDKMDLPADEDIRASRPLKVDLWEDGVLPIVFKKGTSQKTIDLIWAACKEWSAAANVKCIPGPYKNRKLVVSGKYLGIDGGCWSMLGQSAYFLWVKRRMNIGKGCEFYATVLHELGHALGIGQCCQVSGYFFFLILF
ncbi:MAG: M12 family metallopeptidase [Bdellovibrionota bacterium]